MSFRLILTTTVFSLLIAASSQATLVTVPTGLGPGDQYRLAFVTSGTRNASSTNIADYNSFVQSAAEAVPALLSLGATWSAIASTVSVDARDNTGTNPSSTGVPIFLLNDTKLVDNNADLWDGSIDLAFDRTELDTALSVPQRAWTGTESNGEKSSLFRLGGPFNAMYGETFQVNGHWSTKTTENNSGFRHLYSVSSQLSVSSVPEPSAFLMLGLAGLGAYGASMAKSRRRRRR